MPRFSALLPFAPLLLLLGPGCEGCLVAADCRFDSDCDEGEICATGEDGNNLCTTVCDAYSPCTEGLVCVETEGGAACLPPDGAGQLGDPCLDSTDCSSGACIRQGSRAACTLVCGEGDSCPDGTSCYVMELSRVCLAPLDNRTAGESCETPLECESTFCVNDVVNPDNGAVCVNACTPAGACGEGETCVGIDTGAEVCLPALEDGAPCSNPDLCAGGRCIADVDGERICTRECPAFDCDSGWACVPSDGAERVCMPLLDERAPGEDCDSARECSDGYCVGFGEFGTLCAAPCPVEGCPEGEVCWEVTEQPDVCGPMP